MIALLIVLALLQAGDNMAQDVGAAKATTGSSIKGADLDLLEEVRAIGKQISELRGEKFARPPLALRVPGDMRRVSADIRAFNVLSRDRLDARGRAWAEIGLGGSDSPRNLLRVLAADVEGIGFDVEGNRLLVAPELLPATDFEPNEEEIDPATVLMLTGVRPDEPLVGHYLMHVRQRERTGRDPLRPMTDELLASMAWAEGEANLVAVRYLFQGMDLADDMMAMNLNLEEVLDGRLLPSRLQELSGVAGGLARFVYLDGFDRAVAAYRSGGWKALEAAMASRRTTRGLLHPDKAVVPPVAFPAPSAPAIEGLRLVDEDSIGEQAIVVLVSALTGKDNLGLMAGDGWVGDRLYRWEAEGASGNGVEGLTEWVVRWESDAEAADFGYAFGRALEARFPGQALESPGDGRHSMALADRVFRVVRRGAEVRIRIAPTAWDARLGAGEKASD